MDDIIAHEILAEIERMKFKIKRLEQDVDEIKGVKGSNKDVVNSVIFDDRVDNSSRSSR